MKILIKNFFFVHIAYDDHGKVICKIKNSPFGKRQSYIYDSDNKLRFITDMASKRSYDQNTGFHTYQIIENISGTNRIKATAQMSDTTEEINTKQFCFRPPFINKLMICLKNNDAMITVHLNRNGSSSIIDKEGKTIGEIHKKFLQDYLTWYNDETMDKFLFCAINELTKYLYSENEFIIV